MTRAVLLCVQCGCETGHTWHPARGQWLCDGCGLARWPSADEAERAAVERTGPIELSAAPSPVLTEET